MTLKKKPFEKIVGKEKKKLVISIFSYFHNTFYPIKNRLEHLSDIYFVISKCFQFGKKKLFFGKGLIEMAN